MVGMKNYDKAIDEYNMAISLFPDFAVAYNNRGVAYLSQKQLEKALEDFNKALALNPTYVDAYYSRGYYYVTQERYDDAIRDFTEAIRLNPDNPSFYGLRGKAYVKKGEYVKAIKDLDRAISAYPGEPSYYVNRGLAFDGTGQIPSATRDYNKALLSGSQGCAYLRPSGDCVRETGSFRIRLSRILTRRSHWIRAPPMPTRIADMLTILAACILMPSLISKNRVHSAIRKHVISYGRY